MTILHSVLTLITADFCANLTGEQTQAMKLSRFLPISISLLLCLMYGLRISFLSKCVKYDRLNFVENIERKGKRSDSIGVKSPYTYRE